MINKQKKTIRPMNLYLSVRRATMSGWTVSLSSDGYSTYGIGNHLTNDNYGKNGFGNPNAWCVLSNTINNQQYQFCLQTDGYMGLRIKYSKLGFNNGLETLDATPGSSDQKILIGSGTDINPSYQQILSCAIRFQLNNVSISVTTATNILNFTLEPVVTIKPVILKPVVNTVLK